MKQKLFLGLSIGSIVVLFLRWNFGVIHENSIVNIIIFIGMIIVVGGCIKSIKRSKTSFVIISCICSITILILMFLYTGVRVFADWIVGPQTILEEFTFPSSNKESLKNVYYANTTKIHPPIELIYEKEIFLGIKCSVVLKSNSENTDLFDLKDAYQKLEKFENTGICNHKIKSYNLDFKTIPY